MNGGGDPWYTDGRVAVLTLANVWVPPALGHAHGVIGSRFARAVLHLSRRLLPGITRLPSRLHAVARTDEAGSQASRR